MRPIAAKSLVLTVDMQATEATCRRKVSNLFITSAFACTPPLPRISFKGAITDVIITSNGDFDAAHPAGTDLADYFAIIDADDLNFYEQKNGGFNVQRSFALKQNPAAAGRHQFTIIYKLSNGADIQAVCSPVNLYL